MSLRRTFIPRFVAIAAAAVSLSGCIGTYNNTSLFSISPTAGMPEEKLLKTYGTPAFAGNVENKRVYTFKARDNKYIILVGLYEGYDLVVTCRGGVVEDVGKVERPSCFTLFQPVPWAEGQD